MFRFTGALKSKREVAKVEPWKHKKGGKNPDLNTCLGIGLNLYFSKAPASAGTGREQRGGSRDKSVETRTQVSALKMHPDELREFVTQSKMCTVYNEVAKRNEEVRGSTRVFVLFCSLFFNLGNGIQERPSMGLK